MAGRADPVERILNGAVAALSRFGMSKLSMTDVSNEAGVSRGTLYRYFSTKGELVDALGEHVLSDLVKALKREFEDEQPVDPIAAVVRALVRYAEEHPMVTGMVAVEPRLVRDFCEANFGRLVRQIAECLVPPGTEPDDGVLKLAEVIFRLALSFQIVDARQSLLAIEDIQALAAVLPKPVSR